MYIRLISIILKEFLAAIRDPKARVILFAPPLIQIFVFSFAMTQEAKNVSLGVLNHDRGKSGAMLVERFANARTFTDMVMISGNQEIAPLLERQRVLCVLVIPQDFSRKIEAGESAQVQLLLDARQTNAAQIVAGYSQQIVASFGREVFAGNVEGNASPFPIDVRVRHFYNVNLDFIHYTLPSLICILATVICLLLSSLSVAREREMGTFEQLLVSPLTPGEILIGKAVPALCLAMLSATMLILIIIFGFGIPMQGDPFVYLTALAVFLLSIIGIGLFISAMSMTQQQAILGGFLFMPPAVMLSGFATPVENMPHWLEVLTLANPLRWFLVISRGIFLKAMPAEEVFYNTIPLILIALVTLVAAALLFKNKLE